SRGVSRGFRGADARLRGALFVPAERQLTRRAIAGCAAATAARGGYYHVTRPAMATGAERLNVGSCVAVRAPSVCEDLSRSIAHSGLVGRDVLEERIAVVVLE